MTPYQQEYLRRTRKRTGTQAGNAMIGATAGGNMGKTASTPGASPLGSRSTASTAASQGGVLGGGQSGQRGLLGTSNATASDYRNAAGSYSRSQPQNQASQYSGPSGNKTNPLGVGDDRELVALRSTLDKISSIPSSAPASPATGRDYRDAAAKYYQGQQNRYREANDLELGSVGPAVTAATIADFQESARNRKVAQAKSPYGHNPLAGLGVEGASRGGVFTSGTQVHGAMPEATNQSRRKVVQNLSPTELAARDPELAPEKLAARKRAMQIRYGLEQDGSSPTPRTRAELIGSRTDLSDSQKAMFMNNAYARRMDKGLPVPGAVQDVIGGAPVSGLAFYNPSEAEESPDMRYATREQIDNEEPVDQVGSMLDQAIAGGLISAPQGGATASQPTGSPGAASKIAAIDKEFDEVVNNSNGMDNQVHFINEFRKAMSGDPKAKAAWEAELIGGGGHTNVHRGLAESLGMEGASYERVAREYEKLLQQQSPAGGDAAAQPTADDMAAASQRYTPVSTAPNSQARRYSGMASRYGQTPTGDFRGGVARLGDDPDPKGVAAVIATNPPTYVLNDGTETRTRPGGGSQEPAGPAIIPAQSFRDATQTQLASRGGAAPQGNLYQQATSALLAQRGAAAQGGSPANAYRQQALANSQPAEAAVQRSGLSPQAIRQQLALQDRLQQRERINNRYNPSAELQIGRAAAAGNPYAMETFRRLQENSRDNAVRIQESQARLFAEQARAQALGQQYGARSANDAARIANEGKLVEAQIKEIEDRIERGGDGESLEDLRDRVEVLTLGKTVAGLERDANMTPRERYDRLRLAALADGASSVEAAAAAARGLENEGIEFTPPEVDMIRGSGLEGDAAPEEMAMDLFGRLHESLRYGQKGGGELTQEGFSRAYRESGMPPAALRSYLEMLEDRRPKFSGHHATYPGDWYGSASSAARIETEIARMREILGLEPLAALPDPPAPSYRPQTAAGPYAGF